MTQTWQEANKWEHEWHGDCILSEHNEVSKQYAYAELMGLNEYATNYFGMRGWNFGDKSILDMGCGPYSILLKSKAKNKVGVDPCDYPNWVNMRYKTAFVNLIKVKGEDFTQLKSEIFPELIYDETLLYNCLQHTEDPEKIIKNLLACSKIIRVFEWIDAGITDGHIQNLTEENLNKWLGGIGKVKHLNTSKLVGKCYVGIFKGNHYEQ